MAHLLGHCRRRNLIIHETRDSREKGCSANIHEDLIHAVTVAAQSLATKTTKTTHKMNAPDKGPKSFLCVRVPLHLLAICFLDVEEGGCVLEIRPRSRGHGK